MKQGKLLSFINWFKTPAGDVWLFIIALVLLNLVASKSFFRVDLTAERSYSISPATRQVLATLEEPLSVKVFFSDNLPAPYSGVEQYVEDILSEYKNSSRGNFTCEFFDMDDYEDQKVARSYGLSQFQIREIKNNEVGTKYVFMGLALSYADQSEKLDAITSSEGFEYKLTSAISKLVSNTNALSGLTGSVTVTLYKSESMAGFGIQGFDRIDEKTREAFNAANKTFGGRLELRVQNPTADEAVALGEKYGIQVVSWKAKDGTEGHGAMGIVVEYAGKARVVPLEMANMIFQYVVAGLDDLEENITESVKSVVSKTTQVAYITGHGEHALDDEEESYYFQTLLEDTYELEQVNLAQEEIPVSCQSLIVNGPKEPFSDEELYKIDQFILRGGNAVFFVDPFDQIMPPQELMQYQQPVYRPIKSGLEKLLDKWGIAVGKEYVMDEVCFSNTSERYGKLDFYFAPRLQKSSLDQRNPISRGLGDVILLQTAELDCSKAEGLEGVKLSVLAKTSPRSWLLESEEGFVLSPLTIMPPAEDERFTTRNLAVLLEGKVESAFSKKPGDDEDEGELLGKSHIASSTQDSRIFVVGSSMLTTSQLLQRDSHEPVAYFVRNAVDYVSGKEDFCAMRTKNLSLNNLKVTSGKLVQSAKYFNQVGLAVLVVIWGLCVWASRKRRRERIRRAYLVHEAGSAMPSAVDDSTNDENGERR